MHTQTLSEQEALDREAMLVDDSGERGGIVLSEHTKDALIQRGLIYYCGHCTANTTGKSYEAREYHTTQDHSFRCIAESGVDVPGSEALVNGDDELCDACRRFVKTQHIGLVVYGELSAMLVADKPLSEEEWRERVDAAAIRSDHIEDIPDTDLDPSEGAAYRKGLAALLCYRHSDLRQEHFIEIAPMIDGW